MPKYEVTVSRIYQILVEADRPQEAIEFARQMSDVALRTIAGDQINTDIEIRPERGSHHFPQRPAFPPLRLKPVD